MNSDSGPREVYLDHNATTPLDPRVKRAMGDYLKSGGANPHSSGHKAGWRAAEAVDRARRQVAALLNVRAENIVFTSGATEANNLGILGRALAAEREYGGPGHLLCSAIEHPSVCEVCHHLTARGWALEVVPVDRGGLLDPLEVARRLRPETRIVAVMAANHEIGTLQPVQTIAELCSSAGVVYHCDATQAAGKAPLDAGAPGIGLLSLSAHKIYGPMGIGALYIEGRTRIAPLLHGGNQERGLRPGTVPVPLAVGFGAAADLCRKEMVAEAERLKGLRDALLQGLGRLCPDLTVNGVLEPRLAGNLNIHFPGVAAEDLLLRFPDLHLSTGAACATGRPEPSPVLRALGLTPQEIAASIRIGLGRFTTQDDVEFTLERLSAGLSRSVSG